MPRRRRGRRKAADWKGEEPTGGKGRRGRAGGLRMVGFICLCMHFHPRLRRGLFSARESTSRSTPFPAGEPTLSANQSPSNSVSQSELTAVSEPEQLRRLAAVTGRARILFGGGAALRNPAGTSLWPRGGCGWGGKGWATYLNASVLTFFIVALNTRPRKSRPFHYCSCD